MKTETNPLDDWALNHLERWLEHRFAWEHIETAKDAILSHLASLDESDRNAALNRGWVSIAEECVPAGI